MSGLILLAVIGVIVLFLILAGGGLLFFFFKRTKKAPAAPPPAQGSLSSAPQQQAPFGNEASHQAPAAPAQPYASPEPPAAPPWGAPTAEPWGASAPAPEPWGAGAAQPPRESFETQADVTDRGRDTQEQHGRPATVAMHSNMGQSTSPTRDQSLFETTPSADAEQPYGIGGDPFATSPNAPPVLGAASGAPPAILRGTDNLVVRLDPSGTKLGRHPECGYVIPTPGASRQHAEVRFQEGAWVVSDLNSGNGTFVNGVRVRAHRLEPGDEIRIDQTLMTFNFGQ